MNKSFFFVPIALAIFSCGQKGEVFTNPSPKASGILFKNEISETDGLNILDYLYFYNGGGTAVGDINNDGLPDIYLSGNQVKNKLYLNKGGMQFEDITEKAGVSSNSSWNTGAVMGDVNADGFLDIYVCAVVGINGFNGHNELFINNGDNTFTEQSAAYGLDYDTYSSNAAFLDYDLDGDLDIYLLNHAVHTSESYGDISLREQRSYETGDKLLRNDGDTFVDVSEAAGIIGGINAYGLGVAVSDFNQDGYPDIYVGNDFHEDDYYYLNNGDGTFAESLRNHFGHTSRFSMGNDVADINHDGMPDLISLDMLPQDEIPLKSSEGDDNIQTQKLRIGQFGYHYQFTRNMLYVNQPDGNYMETALLSGVAATDWSWSALFADYDLDGEQDLFVSNGIPKRPNDLDFIKFVSNNEIQNKINNTKLVDQKAFELMPSGAVGNYVFKGKGQLQFEDRSNTWIANDTLISGATAMGDFDNDGDLDLVVNNLNATASIYENLTDDSKNHLKLRFKYSSKNPFGIGTKVYAYIDGSLHFRELYTVRGFQASSEPTVHFGLDSHTKVDSINIIWPDRSCQTLKKIAANQTLTVTHEPTSKCGVTTKTDQQTLFVKTENVFGIDLRHQEDNYTDFIREKLIPYQLSDRGPAFALGDLNNDGKKDILLGGSKFIPPKTYVQTDSGYVAQKFSSFHKDSIKEHTSALIADFNGDGRNDVVLGTGGGDFFGRSKTLTESYFQHTAQGYQDTNFPELFQNTSVIKASDYDQDGDLDLFVGGHTLTGSFGTTVPSYLLKNDSGNFTIDPNFELSSATGMVTDALWSDFDQDGDDDLILIGEWMSPLFFKNENGSFTKIQGPNISGLWQAIHPFDIDGDGDTDYLLGNWGLNSKFKATEDKPLKLYFGDFDANGQTETITAFEKEGDYYPLEGLDALSSQMVFLRKKFNTYKSFAGQTVEAVFGKEILDKATLLEVNTLASGYLKNENGTFQFIPFATAAQTAPIMAFVTYDFDSDGKDDVLAGGNYFGTKPYHGRFDSFPGVLIPNENDIILGSELGLDFTQKSIRHLSTITMNSKPYLLAIFNNAPAEVYEIRNSKY